MNNKLLLYYFLKHITKLSFTVFDTHKIEDIPDNYIYIYLKTATGTHCFLRKIHFILNDNLDLKGHKKSKRLLVCRCTILGLKSSTMERK
jgi:hypothetical protein